jgi:hypothetical protein
MAKTLSTDISKHHWIGDPLYVLSPEQLAVFKAIVNKGIPDNGVELDLPFNGRTVKALAWYAFKGPVSYKLSVKKKFTKFIPNDSNFFIRIPLTLLDHVDITNIDLGYISQETAIPSIKNNIYTCGTIALDSTEE